MRRHGVLWGLACVCCFLLVLGTAAVAAEAGPPPANDCGEGLTQDKVISMLWSGGFSGWLEGDFKEPSSVIEELKITKIGSVRMGKDCLNLFLYVLNHHIQNCAARHQMTRLLVLTDTEYLGSYTITEYPLRLEGNVLVFPRDKRFPNMDLGYKIVFGPEGPPKEVYLLGETHRFVK